MSVYKFVDLVGTSPKSWEDAALNVVKEAGRSLDELRIAEVMQKDLEIERGKTIFRIKLRLSFKYLREEEEAPAAKPAQKEAATPKKKADKKKPEVKKEKPKKAQKKKAPEKK
jgi:flavin-binding protein dodecin